MKKLITIVVLLTLLLIVSFQPKIDKVPSYSVVFYSSGGTYISTMEVRSNQTIHEPKAPLRRASLFDGWYTTPTFEEGTEFNFKTKINKSITLYAKWQNSNYKVEYELGDGFWPSEEAQALYKTEFSFDSNILYFKPNQSKNHPKHPGGVVNMFMGWRIIPQDEYNLLTAEEKQLSKYRYIDEIKPKEDDLDELYGEGDVLVLYAHYRNL